MSILNGSGLVTDQLVLLVVAGMTPIIKQKTTETNCLVILKKENFFFSKQIF